MWTPRGRFAYEGMPSRASAAGEAGGASSTEATSAPRTQPSPSQTSETARSPRATTRPTVSGPKSEGGQSTVGTIEDLLMRQGCYGGPSCRSPAASPRNVFRSSTASSGSTGRGSTPRNEAGTSGAGAGGGGGVDDGRVGRERFSVTSEI